MVSMRHRAHLKLEIFLRAHRCRQVARDWERVVLGALQRGDHLQHRRRLLMSREFLCGLSDKP